MADFTTTDVHVDGVTPGKDGRRKLKGLRLHKVAIVPTGANPDAHILLFKAKDEPMDVAEKAEWSTADVNNLPDASFAYISPGGKKDAEGKTAPRTLRHLPYKTASGAPDAAHVRNGLSRLDQTDIPASAKASAKRKLMAAAKQLKIDATEKMRKDMMGLGDDDESPPMTTNEMLQQRQLWEQWRPLWYAFTDSVCAIMDGDDDDAGYAPLLMQSIDEFRDHAMQIVNGLGLLAKATPFFDELDTIQKAGAIMAAGRKQRLEAAIAALQAILDEAEPKTTASETTTAAKGASTMAWTDELTQRAESAEALAQKLAGDVATLKAQGSPEIAEALAKATARIAAMEVELQKAKGEDPDEELWKGVSPILRKKFEEQDRRVASAEQVAKNERSMREQGEYIEKTAGFRQVGLAPDDWEVLKDIDGLPDKSKSRVLQVLRSANEMLKQSDMFKEYGFNGSGGAAGSMAERVTKMAQERAAGSGGKLTFHQAYDQVCTENPKLFNQMRAEQRS